MVVIFIVVLLLPGCAGRRATESGAPRSSGPLYPLLYQPGGDRFPQVQAAWMSLARSSGAANAPLPELQPVTATIRSLPAAVAGNLRLPQVGAGIQMTDEEIRESLRRFLSATQPLVGAQPQQLTLVETTAISATANRALYEQKLFRYPIRNGYGIVRIGFTPDRRVIEFTSTCLPTLEAVQRPLASVQTTITPDQAAKVVSSQPVLIPGPNGPQSFTVNPGDSIDVRQLVLYPTPPPQQSDILLVHLAWEIFVGKNAQHTVYLDAVNGQILGGV
jgi:hypothetical protein